MMIRPLVSVIIIFLDAEKFLDEAIQSVMAQTYPDWELLLIDDGSSDGSTEIARTLARRYPQRVSYLEHAGHQNLGMSASRNLGIRHSAGKYLAFLDADDAWYPSTLEEQTAILESQPEAALVYGRLLYWRSWSGRFEDRDSDRQEDLGVPADRLIQPPSLLPKFLQDTAAVPTGFLIRRQAVDDFGAFEEAFRGEYEDQVFMTKICLNAPVYPSDRCWYRYRQHAESSVSVGQATGQTHAARLRFLDWIQFYLTQQKVVDRKVWRAVKMEYWQFSHPGLYTFLRHNRGRFPWAAGLWRA